MWVFRACMRVTLSSWNPSLSRVDDGVGDVKLRFFFQDSKTLNNGFLKVSNGDYGVVGRFAELMMDFVLLKKILSCQSGQAYRLAWVSVAPSLRVRQPDEAPSSSSARIAPCQDLGSGVPPGPIVKPNKLVLLF
ncbi:hypothetical protein E3N88_35199 [Mikania micrantha]|uniref:Uncharacterized protein n=1 Tax=Mikania micrantha TaxID=192012 RepID=A0A5N6M0A2_9ASTR|nr:hypothetical protein E3N88_35199 [Mikania micrantha]